ncbi:MAG: peptidase M48 [Desulfuromonas sp.]|nr:MAG: peptidase M48 [Desulfuromonas sp.]
MNCSSAYFDGKSSNRRAVTLTLGEDHLFIKGDGVDLTVPNSELRLSSPLGSGNRSIYLKSGAKCEFNDPAFARMLQKKLGKGGFFAFVHRWENSLKLSALALVLLCLAVWAFIRFGIPVLSEQIAYSIPVSAEIAMGEKAFAMLDKGYFSPSEVEKSEQEKITALFNGMLANMAEDQRNYRLVFRDSELFGANAFALPGGTVIITDDLLELVDHDAELLSVLAHEVGHIRGRHALRQVIQNSSSGILIAALTGDILSSSSLAAGIPTLLVSARYSRDMEREADAAAADYMRSQQIPLAHFADMLQKLQDSVEQKGRGDAPSALDYLSTHPATAERIARLNAGN